MPADHWPFLEKKSGTQHLGDKKRQDENERRHRDKDPADCNYERQSIARNKRPAVDLYGIPEPKPPKKKRRNLYDDTNLDNSEDEYQDKKKHVMQSTKTTTMIVVDDDLPDVPFARKQQQPARRVPRMGEPLSLFMQQEVPFPKRPESTQSDSDDDIFAGCKKAAKRKQAPKDQSKTTASTATTCNKQPSKEGTENGNSSPGWKQKRSAFGLNGKMNGVIKKTSTGGSIFNSSVVRSKSNFDGKSVTKSNFDGKSATKTNLDGKSVTKSDFNGKIVAKSKIDGKSVTKTNVDGKSVTKTSFDRKSETKTGKFAEGVVGKGRENKRDSDALIEDLISSSSRNQTTKPAKIQVDGKPEKSEKLEKSEKSMNVRSDKSLISPPEKSQRHTLQIANRNSTATIDSNRNNGILSTGHKKPAISTGAKGKSDSPNRGGTRDSVGARGQKRKRDAPQLYDLADQSESTTSEDTHTPRPTSPPLSDEDGSALPDVLQYVDRERYERREKRRVLVERLKELGVQQAEGRALKESMMALEQRIAEDSVDVSGAYEPPEESEGLPSSFDGTEPDEPDDNHPAWSLDIKREMAAIKPVFKGIIKGQVPSDRHDLFFRSRKDRAGLKRMSTVQDWPRQCVQEVGEILVGWFCAVTEGSHVDLDRLAYVLDVLLPEAITRLTPRAEEMARRQLNNVSEVIVIE
eukprot:comp17239_c0_seq1/m.16269 comp17239_c0_seq1/g.16269  ORF comp17239_c0_seq1/g.16269 comp17239_c0_seq1/m.16269 type:complete len:689 (-) comp17239_c0_seq1:358-2424(-)